MIALHWDCYTLTGFYLSSMFTAADHPLLINLSVFSIQLLDQKCPSQSGDIFTLSLFGLSNISKPKHPQFDHLNKKETTFLIIDQA